MTKLSIKEFKKLLTNFHRKQHLELRLFRSIFILIKISLRGGGNREGGGGGDSILL